MPFNVTTGQYTPPAGATSAATGQVIQSAIWNTIHADLSAALTQIGEGGVSFPQKLVAFADNVSLGTVADTAMTIVMPTSIVWLRNLVVYNSGTVASLTSAAFGLFSGAGATGTTIIPVTALSGITSNTVNVGANLVSIGAPTTVAYNFAQLFFRVATVQANASANIYIYGQGLP